MVKCSFPKMPYPPPSLLMMECSFPKTPYPPSLLMVECSFPKTPYPPPSLLMVKCSFPKTPYPPPPPSLLMVKWSFPKTPYPPPQSPEMLILSLRRYPPYSSEENLLCRQNTYFSRDSFALRPHRWRQTTPARCSVKPAGSSAKSVQWDKLMKLSARWPFTPSPSSDIPTHWLIEPIWVDARTHSRVYRRKWIL